MADQKKIEEMSVAELTAIISGSPDPALRLEVTEELIKRSRRKRNDLSIGIGSRKLIKLWRNRRK